MKIGLHSRQEVDIQIICSRNSALLGKSIHPSEALRIPDIIIVPISLGNCVCDKLLELCGKLEARSRSICHDRDTLSTFQLGVAMLNSPVLVETLDILSVNATTQSTHSSHHQT